jgi:hypothetical protein
MATKWGSRQELFPFFLEIFLIAFLCLSQQGEFKNTTKKRFGGSPCQKKLAEKVDKKNLFPVVFPLRFLFYRIFGRFSA